MTVRGDSDPSRGLVELYYMAFLIGFFVSGGLFYALNKLFPYHGYGGFDDVDVYGTFTAAEAAKQGVVRIETPEVLQGLDSILESKMPMESVAERKGWAS